MKITKYNPTPIEKIKSWGYASKVRKRLDKELNQRMATEEEKRKARESWEAIKKIYG